MVSNIKYTDKFLLDEIRRFVKENGRNPTAKDFKPASGYPSNTTYQKRFGSWNNALISAKCKINQMGTYSDEFLLDELHRYVNEYNKNPTYDSMVELKNYPSARVYEVHFGSWNDALKVAGLDVNVITDYSETFLIEELKRFYKENNRSPAMSDFNNSNYPSVSTYVRRFGSWDKALELASLDLNDVPYTKEELVNKILEFYKEYNKVPTTIDFDNNNNYPSYGTYRRYFNNWDEALECAGLYKDDFLYSDECLLSELHRFVDENGRNPTRDDFDYNKEYPSGRIYYLRFGTWNNALKIANIPINKPIFDYDLKIECGHCGKILKTNAVRDEAGITCCRPCRDKLWRKSHPEIISKQNQIRRGYGFYPLNKYFKGSDAHHLWLIDNKDAAIYIPSFLHKLYPHNHKKPETLTTPNAIALDFLINQQMYTKLYLTGDV